jgi:hypothetical protein
VGSSGTIKNSIASRAALKAAGEGKYLLITGMFPKETTSIAEEGWKCSIENKAYI